MLGAHLCQEQPWVRGNPGSGAHEVSVRSTPVPGACLYQEDTWVRSTWVGREHAWVGSTPAPGARLGWIVRFLLHHGQLLGTNAICFYVINSKHLLHSLTILVIQAKSGLISLCPSWTPPGPQVFQKRDLQVPFLCRCKRTWPSSDLLPLS